jgi:hypothetical protein
MPRAVWPALSLLLLTQAALAAQGVHPGPLPAPLSPDGTGSGSGQGETDRHGGGYGYGSAYGSGYGVEPRESTGYGPPAGAGGSSAPRGYWQWVPVEPSSQGDYDYGRSEPAYRGQADGYPPRGYAAPPPGGPGDSYPGVTSPPAHERQWPAYPGFGGRSGERPEGYYPAPGQWMEPPAGPWDAAPSTPPAAPPPGRR